jgi:hypothetical protein
MAVLRPTLEACMKDKCGGIYFKDTTGVYDVTNNPYGWGDPNLEASELTEVTLTIEYPDGSETEHDLLDQIPDPITGTIEFDVIKGTYDDGIYTFTYYVSGSGKTGTTSVTKILKKLFLCNVTCCVDKMWAKIPTYINTKDEKFLQNYITQTHYAQGLINGLSAAGGCLNTTAVTAILDKIERICEYEKCDTCH